MRKVVITGLGVCTDLAQNIPELWSQVAYAFRPVEKSGKEEFSTLNETLESGKIALTEALKNACLLDANQAVFEKFRRLTFLVSASKPFIGPDITVAPDFIGRTLCEQFHVEGERQNVIAACATGAYTIALGASAIEQGQCDIVVAGSVEPPAHGLIEAGFKKMGVVSKERTMRPFDRQRSGFVLASGAGVVVLESEQHATQRGVPILARLTGWGLGADPHSAVAFNSNGEHIAQVIRKALKRASLDPGSVRHVNAHGTATRLNDWIETQALIKAFGPEAKRLMISGTKSSTGHLLGAAGSVELVLAVQALKEQFVPPTAHLQEPDPDCPLDYTPLIGHAASFEHALSLSFGFGGPIGALIVSRN